MNESINSVTITVGTLAGTLNTPVFRVPVSDSAFGGITLTGAYIKSIGTLTSELALLVGTALGTAITGTLGTNNATIAANVPKAFTIATAYVASGSWIHLRAGAGMAALPATNIVILEYKWGK
jgi:hypothetical protein